MLGARYVLCKWECPQTEFAQNSGMSHLFGITLNFLNSCAFKLECYAKANLGYFYMI